MPDVSALQDRLSNRLGAASVFRAGPVEALAALSNGTRAAFTCCRRRRRVRQADF